MQSKPLDILFENDRLIAANKPAGLATIPGRGEKDSVLQSLARQLGIPASGTADPRLRVVHRLDKQTSGVLLFARDIAAQRFISEQFQNGKVHKEYLALVTGRPSGQHGEIRAPLGPHPIGRDRMIVTSHGKDAITLWTVERAMKRFAVLRCIPQTGRTHQIRVHLKSIGLPLAVDELYSPVHRADGRAAGIYLSEHKRDYRPTRGEIERPLIARLTLHAEILRFTHPSGQEISLKCPLPKDFRAAINQLVKI